MNDQRVARLLDNLRQRTPEEIGNAVMLFGPALTPEFWRALELLRMERSAQSKKAEREDLTWMLNASSHAAPTSPQAYR